MKKILTIILAGFMLLTLGACGGAGGNTNGNTSSSTDDNNNVVSNAMSNTETPADQPETTSDGSKVLVAYFSYSGNTKSVAEKIQAKTNADIFEIDTTYDYPEEYNAVIDQAQQEQRDKARPELRAAIDNLADYDTVFIGYPNWWGDMPMVVYSFLDEYDLSGKTVIPFCTHGGSGLSGTVNSIKNEEPNADVKGGLAIRDNALSSADSAIDAWLGDLGF